MDYPMRVYGPNVYELVLTDCLAGLGLALIGWAVAVAIMPETLGVAATAAGGLLAGATGGAGAVLILAGSGPRQNRAALDLGEGLLAITSLAWLSCSIVMGRVVPIVAGAVMVALACLIVALRRAAIHARFKPRFFSARQFETMVAVADTMIDGDGREAIDPISIAVNVDHLLAQTDGPAPDQIRLLMRVVEWLLPLLLARPIPFSSLGSGVRRRVITRVIDSTGLLRAVARTLKVLSSFGYYGNPQTMLQIGYVPFDERPRAATLDETPAGYADPFLR
jgi:hypothetical protein